MNMSYSKLLMLAHKGALTELDHRKMQLGRAQRRMNTASELFLEDRIKEIEEDLAWLESEKRGFKEGSNDG